MTFSKCYLVLTKCLVIFSKCFVVLTKCFVVFSKYYLVFSTCAAPFHARTKASRACAHTYARTRAITHFITVIFPQTIHQASYPPHFQLGDGCIVGPQNYTPTVHQPFTEAPRHPPVFSPVFSARIFRYNGIVPKYFHRRPPTGRACTSRKALVPRGPAVNGW